SDDSFHGTRRFRRSIGAVRTQVRGRCGAGRRRPREWRQARSDRHQPTPRPRAQASRHARGPEQADRDQRLGPGGKARQVPKEISARRRSDLMPEFAYREMFDLSHANTPYRKLSGDFVARTAFDGKDILKVAPEALTLLAAQAFGDIAH